MRAAVAPLTILPTPPMSPQAIDLIVGEAPIYSRDTLATFGGSFATLEEGLKTYLAPKAGS